MAALAESISNYPNYDNYVMSASALLRLQDTYDLETYSIAGGFVSSSAASSLSMSGMLNSAFSPSRVGKSSTGLSGWG